MTAVRAAGWLVSALVLAAFARPSADATPLESYLVAGDAIDTPLGGATGDGSRGRDIALDRGKGNCLICHRVPIEGELFPGDVGPDLSGIGARLTAGQIRLRLVDQSVIAPLTLMPSYYRVDGLRRVGEQFRGKPVLTAQEIEDVVAWLQTLR
ncbi:MAG: sulfur oxidation c-type cytochrome SoxX [Hyphomicrobium sp.]|nr:sulfur oxidation c-type cytochrome SoxX [Hyphomicrobium sp.]PPC83127.1 MAG: sulfur oxidation c-type cytochrome SoxX [Hyphomicrobium sp.]